MATVSDSSASSASSTEERELTELPTPPTHVRYESRQAMIREIQAFAKPHGYAITIGRSRNFKHGHYVVQPHKIFFQCDRSAKRREFKGRHRRHGTSRADECPFKMVAVRNPVTDEWKLSSVLCAGHNHRATGAVSYPSQPLQDLTPSLVEKIKADDKAGSGPAQTLTAIRQGDSDSLLTPRDIYNAKAQIRAEQLGVRTPIQALMIQLTSDEEWSFEVHLDRHTNRLNYEVLIMDCTYKINKYRLPLMSITGLTAIGTTFHAGFAFLSGETKKDFLWVLNWPRQLCKADDLPRPTVIAVDRDQALLNALEEFDPEIAAVICLWHVEKYLKNCKRHFDDDQEWKEALRAFTDVLYSPTEQFYAQNWAQFQAMYSVEHPQMLEYVRSTWIGPFKHQIIRCYTNKLPQFGTTTTSRGEGGHNTLKRYLKCSTGDLYQVVHRIKVMLDNQHKNFFDDLENARSKLSHPFRKPLWRRIIGYISPYALWRIYDQYLLYIKGQEENRLLKPCTGSFRATMGMPCNHEIAKLIAKDKPLKVHYIHFHWHFDWPSTHSGWSDTPQEAEEDGNAPSDDANPDLDLDFDSNEELPSLAELVDEPRVIKGKGRPKGSLNKRQQTLENSTQREPSGFEHAEAPNQQRGRGRGGRRGRGQRRGRAGHSEVASGHESVASDWTQH